MKPVLSIKQKVYEQCRQLLSDKLEALQQNLRSLADSAANETKSSAGDKYETGRAMLHIEQAQVRQQIAVVIAQQTLLNTIDPTVRTPHIALGSLVNVEGAWYYLSVGLGKMQIEAQTVFVLSLQSPLGSQLRGLSASDELMINGKKLSVSEVF